MSIIESKLSNKATFRGKKHTKESRKKMSDYRKLHPIILSEEKNPRWKGDKAGYVAIHIWVAKWKGKSDTCEMCGKSGLKGLQIHWANIDHKYRRVLDDYIRLCASCHKIYDIGNGFSKN